MARSSKVEACMFCGDIPCSCNKKPKAVRKPRATKPDVTTPSAEVPQQKARQSVEAYVAATRKPSPFAAMGFVPASEVFKAERENLPIPVREQREPLPKDPDDEFHNALRAIISSGMLDPYEAKRIGRMIPPTVRNPELDARVNGWKVRNGNP